MSNHGPQYWRWTGSLLDTPVGQDTNNRWVLWRPGLDPKELFGRALPLLVLKRFSPAFAIIVALMGWAALCIYVLFGYMRVQDSTDSWHDFAGALLIFFVLLPASITLCHYLFRFWPRTKGAISDIGLAWFVDSTAKKGSLLYFDENWAHELPAAKSASRIIKALEQVQTSRAIEEQWIDKKILEEMHELAWNSFETSDQLEFRERVTTLATSAATLEDIASNVVEIDKVRNEQERYQKDQVLNAQYRTALERADGLAARLKAIREFYTDQGE